MAMNKKVADVQEALKGVENNMTFMLGGFGLCGIPEKAIEELVRIGISGVTCISNNAGVDNFGLGFVVTKSPNKKK